MKISTFHMKVGLRFVYVGEAAIRHINKQIQKAMEYPSYELLERETVISLGGSACSCENFISMLSDTLGDMQIDIAEHNRQERRGYHR